MDRSRRDAEFREAFPRLHERAYQAAFRLLGDRSAAEDAAQEALTRAYVHWARLDERREGWVVTTTVNIVLDGFRRQKRWDAFRTSRAGTAAATGVAVDDTETDRVDLQRLLAALPRRQRQVAVLRYLEDRPVREVADLLGCSIGSVKRHAARAATALRSAFEIDPDATTTPDPATGGV
jgi:RNA polymerase sigma factor (sigma-70 family)